MTNRDRVAAPGPAAPLRASGRYRLFARGVECGEEVWSLRRAPEGFVLEGEQWTQAPHPFPSRQQWRALTGPDWRICDLEILWDVGDRRLRSTHRADGAMWRVRIEYGGHVKEQEGDFPVGVEVDYGSHLFSTLVLARRDFAVGGFHEFTALRVGPPYMAVHPERLRLTCVEAGAVDGPGGRIAARRYTVEAPGRNEPGYGFWADDRGVILESFEGPEPVGTWMRLEDYAWEEET